MSPPESASALLLRNATLTDGSLADVSLREGQIDSVAAAGAQAGREHGAQVDLSGFLLLPAPAEVHAHLDKAFTADRVANPGGDLMGAVQGWLRYRSSMSFDDIFARALRATQSYVANGATAIRTHVDVGDDIGLRALEAVVALRAAVADYCDVQVVAFIANPLSGVAGADHRALLAEALAGGADAVGACPGLDPDPVKCIDICLDLAGQRGVGADLHIDEWPEPDPCTLGLLAQAVTVTGFSHPVVASHCVSLGMMARDRVIDIADSVAAAGITVVCLPQTNLFLQGRQHDTAPPRGLTAVRALRAAGVTVAAGGDNLQDPFNTMGRADPLDTAALLVLAAHDTPENAFKSISSDGRGAIGAPGGAVAVRAPAELLAIRAASVREAIATAAPDRVVIHGGRIVARTTTRREFAGDLLGQRGQRRG